MKKKLLIIMMLSTMALAGCSGNNSDTTTTTTTTEATTEATTEQTTTEATTAEETTTEVTAEEITSGSLENLAKYLLDQGVVSGVTDTPMYEYIGAVNGFKYLDSGVEVYEYDMSSDTYKAIVDNNSVNDITVSAINGPYVLIFSNDEVDQHVIDVFNSFK